MALRQLEMIEKRKRNLELLDEKRAERRTLLHEKNKLEDEINAVDENTSIEKRDELEGKVEEFAAKMTKLEETIIALEAEIEGIEKEIEEFNEKNKASIESSKNENKDERMYKGMENIIFRNNDSFFERNKFSEEEKNLSLGKYVRGMVTGKWKDADAEKRSMLTSGASSLIPAPLHANIVDKARNQSIFTIANVPMVAMETNTLRVAKIKEDLQAAFKKEGEAAEESIPMELEGITLKAKTIYGYAYVSLEAIEAAENLESILYNSFGAAVAEGIDKAMLYGVYSGSEYHEHAPSGIFNDDNIGVVTATDSNYDEIIKGIGRVKAANGTPKAVAINAATEETLSLLKDQHGQYITPPAAYTSVRKIVSNQMAYDETAGSDILVFDPNALLIGVHNGINIKVFDGDTECIKRGLVCFRVMAMIDCVVLQPKHICRIKEFGKNV